MKKDDAKKLCDDALTELASQLAAGRSDELRRYLDAMSRFHRYSFGNCLLIARQYPDATLVAGFHAWKRQGRSVKKGEKGICILAPLARKKEETDDREVFGFRAVHVFDVSQTDGDELPEPNRLSGEPGELLSRLHAVARSLGIDVGYEELGKKLGVSRGGSIALCVGLSPAEEYGTLAHELGHELLHKKRERLHMPESVRELEAEAVGYVVTRAAGIENAVRQAADYIHCYDGDAAMLSKSMERVQKVSTLILESLESVELLEAGGAV